MICLFAALPQPKEEVMTNVLLLVVIVCVVWFGRRKTPSYSVRLWTPVEEDGLNYKCDTHLPFMPSIGTSIQISNVEKYATIDNLNYVQATKALEVKIVFLGQPTGEELRKAGWTK